MNIPTPKKELIMNEEEQKLNFKIDSLQKIITRTDGFHNYANTKSTILITFITAYTVAILTNYKYVIDILNSSHPTCLVVFFKFGIMLALLMLICAFYFVGKTVIPYLQPSRKSNFYSFLDTVHFYNSEQEYFSEVVKAPKEDILNSMASLQYNLSKGLIEKYSNHKKSIICILTSILLLTVSSILIFIA